MSRYVVMAAWDEAPHLTKEDKEQLLASYLPHERDARSKGIPALGSGAIYPISEEELIVEPFQLPLHWPRCYGFDPGWNKTAAVWAAWDKESDVVYLYSEHYRGKAEPSVHADAIKARGEWIPGAIDYAGTRDDGQKILDHYYELGLNVGRADKSVESGLQKVWQRMSSGRLKVFPNLKNWFSEFRTYHRNEDGKIVKANDHLMDATRYLIMSALDWSQVMPDEDDEETQDMYYSQHFRNDVNDITGY